MCIKWKKYIYIFAFFLGGGNIMKQYSDSDMFPPFGRLGNLSTRKDVRALREMLLYILSAPLQSELILMDCKCQG